MGDPHLQSDSWGDSMHADQLLPHVLQLLLLLHMAGGLLTPLSQNPGQSLVLLLSLLQLLLQLGRRLAGSLQLACSTPASWFCDAWRWHRRPTYSTGTIYIDCRAKVMARDKAACRMHSVHTQIVGMSSTPSMQCSPPASTPCLASSAFTLCLS